LALLTGKSMDELGFWPKFVMAVLATWRVTHLLASEDGPADLVASLRARLGSGILGQLMDCFHCLSFWVAAPMAVLVSRGALDFLLIWLALSGAACLLERIGQEPVVIQPISPSGGVDHGMLRSEAGGTSQYAADDNAGRHATGSD